MANPGYGTEAHLDQFKDHQSEREAIRFKESEKEESISAAEQEAVSGPVVIQDSAASGPSPSAEQSSSDPHEIGTALIETLPAGHSTDVKNEPRDQTDLGDPVNKMDEVENRTKTASSPEPQTSHQDHGYSNPYHKRSLDVNGDVLLVQEIEENGMDPKAGDDHQESTSGSVLEHLEEMCFNSETQLQAADEPDILEPPAKKRLRRRMGMCGLGDRKRKLPFDGQHCRHGLVGRQREEEAGKGYKGVALENEPECWRMRKNHEGGGTIAACKEDEENNVTAVMAEETASGVAEKENICALSNMIKCTAVMNEVITDEPSIENNEEKDAAVTMDNKTGAEQTVLEHELSLLEDISSEVGQIAFSPIIGEILNMIQEELSGGAAPSDREMEDVTCGDESNCLGTEMTNHGQHNELNVKHEVLSEKQNLSETEFKGGPEVSSVSICATVEMSEDPATVAEEVHELPTGLKESETKLKVQIPPNMDATEKPEPNRAELGESMEYELDPLFADIMDIKVINSSKIQHAKHHSENEKPGTAVLMSPEPAGGDTEHANGRSESIVPPTGQEYHVQVHGGETTHTLVIHLKSEGSSNEMISCKSDIFKSKSLKFTYLLLVSICSQCCDTSVTLLLPSSSSVTPP